MLCVGYVHLCCLLCVPDGVVHHLRSFHFLSWFVHSKHYFFGWFGFRFVMCWSLLTRRVAVGIRLQTLVLFITHLVLFTALVLINHTWTRSESKKWTDVSPGRPLVRVCKENSVFDELYFFDGIALHHANRGNFVIIYSFGCATGGCLPNCCTPRIQSHNNYRDCTIWLCKTFLGVSNLAFRSGHLVFKAEAGQAS